MIVHAIFLEFLPARILPVLFNVTHILLVLNVFSYVFIMQPKRKQDRKKKVIFDLKSYCIPKRC